MNKVHRQLGNSSFTYDIIIEDSIFIIECDEVRIRICNSV